MNKHISRERRAKKGKALIKNSGRLRLVVHRSGVHIYSQIVKAQACGDVVMATCSTLEKELQKKLSGKNKVDQATLVGKLLGERAKDKGIVHVAFDRAGYKYHGRVKALADGAREAGLDF